MSGEEPIRTRAKGKPRASGFARDWGEETTLAPHPAPEVPCRPATEDEIPRAAKLMRKRAETAGWAVAVTYARGTVMYLTGKPGAVVDSIALRLHKPNRYAWAIWYGTRFEAAQAWDRDVSPFAKNVGAKQLSAWLVAS